MKKYGIAASVAALTTLVAGSAIAQDSGAGSAIAQDTLQLDVNGMGLQVRDSSGAAAAFGGLKHTGSLNFSLGFMGTTQVTGLEVFKSVGGFPFQSAGAQDITGVAGSVLLLSGLVTGGSFTFTLSNGDSYSTVILGGSGMVQTAATPGGYAIDGRTMMGIFTDPQADKQYGTADVSQWIAAQPLPGSFIEFNFSPDSTGKGFSDVDVFVAVPLPPAAYAGLATLAGVMGLSYMRRRR